MTLNIDTERERFLNIAIGLRPRGYNIGYNLNQLKPKIHLNDIFQNIILLYLTTLLLSY